MRRDAVAALRQRATPPREAEPIETGRTLDDYRQILEWAAGDWRAEIETDGGTLTLRLFTRDAPLTCWNFAQLCDRASTTAETGTGSSRLRAPGRMSAGRRLGRPTMADPLRDQPPSI
ncbi:MAG: peptidylprolyl isomerase [Candidatus Eisenbacteria bacterium]